MLNSALLWKYAQRSKPPQRNTCWNWNLWKNASYLLLSTWYAIDNRKTRCQCCDMTLPAFNNHTRAAHDENILLRMVLSPTLYFFFSYFLHNHLCCFFNLPYSILVPFSSSWVLGRYMISHKFVFCLSWVNQGKRECSNFVCQPSKSDLLFSPFPPRIVSRKIK